MKRINPYKMFVGSFIPNWLLQRKEIRAGSKLIYARLAQFAGENGECYPSLDKIAEETGMGLTKVKEHIKNLKDFNLIQSIRRGLGKTNVYIFLEHEWMCLSRKSDVRPSVKTDVRPSGKTDVRPLRESVKENHLKDKNIYKEESHKKEFRSSTKNENSHNFGVSSWQYQIASDFFQLKFDLQEFEYMKEEQENNFQNWAATLNDLNIRFKKTPEIIKKLIDFAVNDPFWSDIFTNISDLTVKKNGKTTFEKIELAMIKDSADTKANEEEKYKDVKKPNYL